MHCFSKVVTKPSEIFVVISCLLSIDVLRDKRKGDRESKRKRERKNERNWFI